VAGRAAFLVLTASLAIQGCAPSETSVESSVQVAAAPSVILIIGDGMDDDQITIARNYLVGSTGRLVLDSMAFRGAVQVQAVAEADPTAAVYVSDSANTATSMATGEVTSPSRIATTAGSDQDLTTIMELAQGAGLKTGIVTTSSVTDATPASFIAHIGQRFCQGPRGMKMSLPGLGLEVDCSPDLKANGGAGSISEQIVDSGIDVVLGGGVQHFDQPAEGGDTATVTDAAIANGYSVVRNRGELMGAGANGRLLGLFSRDTMPVRWRGENDAKAQLLERVGEEVQLPEPFVCEPDPGFEGMPTLAEMTRAALGRLDGDDGFMLMIESASIDKQSHLRRPCGHIGELQQLDEALALALEFAEGHSETLVLVTADHSHAAQVVTDAGGFVGSRYASPGYFARLRTADGVLMGVNYATSDSPAQEYHTGSQIPLFASGAGARDLPSFVAQRELFGIMARHLNLD